VIRLLTTTTVALAFVACAPRQAEPAAPDPEPDPEVVATSAAPVTRPDGSCSVVGIWDGTVPGGILRGLPMDLAFFEGGRARGQVRWVTLNTTWEREGDVLTITDVSAVPALARCPGRMVGRYTLAFADDCSAVHVADGEDPCNHRRLTLLGLQAIRR